MLGVGQCSDAGVETAKGARPQPRPLSNLVALRSGVLAGCASDDRGRVTQVRADVGGVDDASVDNPV